MNKERASRETCEAALADMFLSAEDASPAGFLWKALELRRGARVLEQGCGTGRLALALAARGAQVVGIDLCAAYIRLARERSARADLACEFLRRDAARFRPRAKMDAVFNWYSSFGYFRRDADNLRVLRRAFDALRRGGRFALDWPNMAAVLARFKARRVWRRRMEGGMLRVHRDCSLELGRGLIRVRWSSSGPAGRRGELGYTMRLYLPHQLGEMAAACGFSDVRILKEGGSGALTPDSPRCLLLARRVR